MEATLPARSWYLSRPTVGELVERLLIDRLVLTRHPRNRRRQQSRYGTRIEKFETVGETSTRTAQRTLHSPFLLPLTIRNRRNNNRLSRCSKDCSSPCTIKTECPLKHYELRVIRSRYKM